MMMVAIIIIISGHLLRHYKTQKIFFVVIGCNNLSQTFVTHSKTYEYKKNSKLNKQIN